MGVRHAPNVRQLSALLLGTGSAISRVKAHISAPHRRVCRAGSLGGLAPIIASGSPGRLLLRPTLNVAFRGRRHVFIHHSPHTITTPLGHRIGKSELSRGTLAVSHDLCEHIRVSQYYSRHNIISSERSHRDLNCGLQSRYAVTA